MRDDDEIEFSTPRGWKFAIHGRLVIIIVCCVLLVAYLEDTHRIIISAISEVIYVLTLDQKHREELKMTMPATLKEKLNNNGR